MGSLCSASPKAQGLSPRTTQGAGTRLTEASSSSSWGPPRARPVDLKFSESEGPSVGLPEGSLDGVVHGATLLERLRQRREEALTGARRVPEQRPHGPPPARGPHSPATRLLQQTPAAVEDSLKRAAEMRRRRAAPAPDTRHAATSRENSKEGPLNGRDSSIQGPQKDSNEADRGAQGSNIEGPRVPTGSGTEGPRGPPSSTAVARKVAPQHASLSVALLRLHSIHFCLDRGPPRATTVREKTKVAYCVDVRFLPAQSQPPEDAVAVIPSLTTAWFAATVSLEEKIDATTQKAAAAAAAPEAAEAAEGTGTAAATEEAEGVFQIEKCSFETDVSLPLPDESLKPFLNPNKLLLEIWRHELAQDPAATSTEASAATAAAAAGVHLVGQAVIDCLEEDKTLKGRRIVPIEHPTNSKDPTMPLLASLRRSGTLHATLISHPSKQQQQQQEQQQHGRRQQGQQQQRGEVLAQIGGPWGGDVVIQRETETTEKMWRYIVRLGTLSITSSLSPL